LLQLPVYFFPFWQISYIIVKADGLTFAAHYFFRPTL